MDKGRIWLTRIVAPIVFLVAVVVLVVIVQRALDEGPSAAASAGGTGTGVEVTTDLGETDATPVKKKFYKVKTGDTLEAIATRFDTSVEVLLTLNPDVDPLALEPGQRVRVA
jgi:LysM repeat protein